MQFSIFQINSRMHPPGKIEHNPPQNQSFLTLSNIIFSKMFNLSDFGDREHAIIVQFGR